MFVYNLVSNIEANVGDAFTVVALHQNQFASSRAYWYIALPQLICAPMSDGISLVDSFSRRLSLHIYADFR